MLRYLFVRQSFEFRTDSNCSYVYFQTRKKNFLNAETGIASFACLRNRVNPLYFELTKFEI